MIKSIIISICLIVGLIAGAALAAVTTKTVNPGQMPVNSGTLVQNVTALAPRKAGAVCVAKTIHRAGDIVTFNLYTSNAWYQSVDWKAVNSNTGADFIVQRKLGSNTTGMPGANGRLTVNREYKTYALATFGTATSASITLCQDRQ